MIKIFTLLAFFPSHRLAPFLSLALLLVANSGSLAQTPESSQLEEFVRVYQETWQSHDAERLADFFADESDIIFGIQPRIAGRGAIESWWKTYFSRIDKGRTISIAVDSIRVPTPDVAIINVRTTTSGLHSKTKEALQPREARGTWVVARVGGDWKIIALRMHPPVGERRQGPGTDT